MALLKAKSALAIIAALAAEVAEWGVLPDGKRGRVGVRRDARGLEISRIQSFLVIPGMTATLATIEAPSAFLANHEVGAVVEIDGGTSGLALDATSRREEFGVSIVVTGVEAVRELGTIEPALAAMAGDDDLSEVLR